MDQGPLGKLDTERMVPLDEEILDLIDHIADIRSPGRPLSHPRYRRPAQFLFTHHGRRLAQSAVRAELDRWHMSAEMSLRYGRLRCHRAR